MNNIEISKELSSEILNFIGLANNHSKIPLINIVPQFLISYDKHIRKDWKPLFIKVMDHGNIIGLYPLMYKNDYRKKLVPYRRIKFYGSDFSDFQDIFATAGHREIVLRESFKWLMDNFRWEEMILDDLLDDTEIVKQLEELLREQQLSHSIRVGKYYYIDLAQSWEEIIKNFSKSFVRENYKNAVNRITKAGNWTIEFDPIITAQEIINRAAPIHSKRQNDLKRTSHFSSPAEMKAYREIITSFLERDSFKTFWIKFETKIIGFMFGFYLNDHFYLWNTAFDPDYDFFSPGRILQYDVIEFLHQQRSKEFNFMRGESGYKEKWTNTSRNNYRFRIYNNKSLYGKMLGLVDKNFKTARA